MSETETKHYDSHDAGPEWATPKWLVEPLADSIGGFDLDSASGAESEPHADDQFTIEDDGLAQDWYGHVWINPPYGREHNEDWAEKVLEESRRDEVQSITALVPGSVDTDWFQENYGQADVLTFINGRVKFVGEKDHDPSFPSVIATYGLENLNGDYFDALDDLGRVYPRTESFLRRLVESGHSPAEALDTYFTEYRGHSYAEWARVRDVSTSAVYQNSMAVSLSDMGDDPAQ